MTVNMLVGGRIYRLSQFRLRSLMLTIGLFCVWLGVVVNSARRQREAVMAIEAAGGDVDYGYGFYWRQQYEVPGPAWAHELLGIDFFDDVLGVSFRSGADVGAVLSHAQGLPKLRRLNLNGCRLDDSVMDDVGKIGSLKTLLLESTAISDAGLKQLVNLRELQELALDETQLGDAAMALIAKLPNLRCLWLNRHMSDDGLSQLRGMTRLRYLSVRGRHITDAGIRHLQGIKTLTGVNVRCTQVSPLAIAELRRKLPDAKVTQTPIVMGSSNSGFPEFEPSDRPGISRQQSAAAACLLGLALCALGRIVRRSVAGRKGDKQAEQRHFTRGDDAMNIGSGS